MEKTKEQTVAELQARNKQLEQTISGLKGKDDAVAKAELRAAQAELSEVQAQIKMSEQDAKIVALEASQKQRLEGDAEAAVQRMVAGGKIPTRDTKLQDTYKQKFVADPSLIPLMAGEASQTQPGTGMIGVVGGRITAPAAAVEAARGGDNNGGLGLMLGYQHGNRDIAGALRGIAELCASSGKGGTVTEKFKASYEVAQMYKEQIQPCFIEASRRNGTPSFALQAAAASDTLGTLAGNLVALRTLDLYKFEFPMLDSISTDFSDQPANYNQTTVTRIIVVPAVLSYDATLGGDGRAAGWTVVTPAQTVDASVTLNRHRAVDIIFDANTLASTQRRLFEEMGPAAAYALGKDVVDFLYTKITFANFGGNAGDNAPSQVADVNFGRPTFSKAKRLLNLQGAPFTNRFALAYSTYQEMLEQDPTLVSLAVFQKPEIITDAELPQISRFRPLEAPNLPATAIAGGGVNGVLRAFFAHKSALLMQARIPNDWSTVLGQGMSYGSVNIVTNPDTGLSTLLTQFSNPQSSHAEYRQSLIYGAAVGNSKGGWIVVQ